jgi:hypothetical protein
MKIHVTRFVSMETSLSEIRRFLTREQLHTGKRLAKFGGLLPREIWANWLFCAALNSERKDAPLCFTTDPDGGDGIIYDEANQAGWYTEHVMVPRQSPSQTKSLEELIAGAVNDKQLKGGKSYASGKTLLVFLEAGDGRRWDAIRATKELPANDFDKVWVVSLHSIVTYEWIYNVVFLKVPEDGGYAPVYQVRIEKTKPKWTVVRTQ